jgi:hypothetical protein
MKSYFFLIAFFVLGCTSSSKDEKGQKTESPFENSKSPTTTTTYIFIDITGDNSFKELLTDTQIDEIMKSMGMVKGGSVFNGGLIKIMLINDISMNKSVTMELPKGNSSIVNGETSASRALKVREFEKEITAKGREFLSGLTSGKDESEIYRNLCKQLKTLKSESSDKKNVIIYSDMLENSPIFSLYGGKRNDFDSIIKKANDDCSFPQLDEINIYVIPPINVKNKNLISNAEAFWTKLFEQKNVKKFNGFNVDLTME